MRSLTKLRRERKSTKNLQEGEEMLYLDAATIPRVEIDLNIPRVEMDLPNPMT